MRVAFRVSLLAIGLALCLSAGAVSAGTLVEFPSEHAPKLLGYLARPDRAGPFPLHGCSGASSGASPHLADQLKGWGCVALMVDSFGPRGLVTTCSSPFRDQPSDAYAALQYLSRQDFVAPERIAVIGTSMGAYSALYAVDQDLSAQYFKERFRAADCCRAAFVLRDGFVGRRASYRAARKLLASRDVLGLR